MQLFFKIRSVIDGEDFSNFMIFLRGMNIESDFIYTSFFKIFLRFFLFRHVFWWAYCFLFYKIIYYFSSRVMFFFELNPSRKKCWCRSWGITYFFGGSAKRNPQWAEDESIIFSLFLGQEVSISVQDGGFFNLFFFDIFYDVQLFAIFFSCRCFYSYLFKPFYFFF